MGQGKIKKAILEEYLMTSPILYSIGIFCKTGNSSWAVRLLTDS